jgi:anti-sigma regulatory factor (Ser/Thr protein kinase)
MTDSVDLRLPASREAPKRARDGVERLHDRISAQILDDVRLLVSELVTNSVRHGRLPEAGTIELRAEVTPKGVRVEVTDPGRGFERRQRSGSAERIGGYGLYLVHRLASRWGVDSPGERGTRVWFEIDRARPGDAAV